MLPSETDDRTDSTLIVQLARLGDLVQTWPLIDRLNNHSENSNTSLIVDERLTSLAVMMVGRSHVYALPLQRLQAACSNGAVTNAWREMTRVIKQLRTIKVRQVINLNFHPAAAALAETVECNSRKGASWIDAHKGRPSDPVLFELFNATSGLRSGRRHLSDIWMDYSGGVRLPSVNPLPVPAGYIRKARDLLAENNINSADRLVAVIPGSGLDERRWDTGNFSRVIDNISGSYTILLIGTQKEMFLADQILDALPGHQDNVVSLCGKTDIDTLAGVLSACDLVIGVDTGSLHLAAIIGARCLGIYFGSMNFRETGPYGSGNIVVIPGDPNYPYFEHELVQDSRDHSGSIPVEPVSKCAKAMLNKGEIPTDDRVHCYSSGVGSGGLEWTSLSSHKSQVTSRMPLKLFVTPFHSVSENRS